MTRTAQLTLAGFTLAALLIIVLCISLTQVSAPPAFAPAVPAPSPSPYQTQRDRDGWPVASTPIEHLVNECARASGINPYGNVTHQQVHVLSTCVDLVRGAMATTK